jgi:hypothetical protein
MKPIRCKNKAEFQQVIVALATAGEALHVVALHDNGCAGDPCSCSPEFIIEDLTADNVIAAQKAQAKWLKSRGS